MLVTRTKPCSSCDGKGYGPKSEPHPCQPCIGREHIISVKDTGFGRTKRTSRPSAPGRVDALFDELEVTIEVFDRFSDDLVNIRIRIEFNGGETSAHVRNRIDQNADQLTEEAAATERVREDLESLKRTV